MINKQNALALYRLIIVLVASLAAERSLVAQIYYNNSSSTVGEYSLSGATINSQLISGLQHPRGVAAYGGNIYVGNILTGTIGQYDATTGAAVNPSFITTGPNLLAFVISGGDVFAYNGTSVSEYDATTGSVIAPSLISGLGVSITGGALAVGSSRVDLQACKLEYSIVSPK